MGKLRLDPNVHALGCIAVVLAVLLTLPSVNAGLLMDDYLHKLLMQGSGGPVQILRSPLDMFRLIDGNPEHTHRLIDYGFLPWWTFEGGKGAFCRPLASLTHWADYRLWPDSPSCMHLQSVFWYALLVVAAGLLYHRLIGPGSAAGLAAILFAVDDAHAMPVGWLANRNALGAALFGLLALIAHDRWRRGGWKVGAVFGPLLLLASLLFKEEGVATFAYLLVYAIILERGTLRLRLMALLPYLTIIIIWRIAWSQLGYGVANIGWYIDPLQEPFRFAQALPYRFGILLAGQLGFPPPGIIQFLPQQSRKIVEFVMFLYLVLVAYALWPLLRRNQAARFCAVAMLLSLIPACATLPDDRLLMFAGIGGMGLIALFLRSAFAGPLFVRAVAVSLILIHLVIAPAALALRSSAPMAPRWLLSRVYLSHPLDAAVRGQDLIIVNPPLSFLMLASPLEWAAEDAPMPRHIRVLTSSLLAPVTVERKDERTILVTPTYGFIGSDGDKLVRPEPFPLRTGDTIRLTGMSAQVLASRNGNPMLVAFRFAVPLEDRSLRWLQWRDNRFLPFEPPKVGQTVVLPGPTGGIGDLFRASPDTRGRPSR